MQGTRLWDIFWSYGEEAIDSHRHRRAGRWAADRHHCLQLRAEVGTYYTVRGAGGAGWHASSGFAAFLTSTLSGPQPPQSSLARPPKGPRPEWDDMLVFPFFCWAACPTTSCSSLPIAVLHSFVGFPVATNPQLFSPSPSHPPDTRYLPPLNIRGSLHRPTFPPNRSPASKPGSLLGSCLPFQRLSLEAATFHPDLR
jgi:hypothetical protein